MKKSLKALFMVFAVAFGVLLLQGTTSKATVNNLVQTGATTTRVDLQWAAVLGSDRYVVQFSQDGQTNWTEMTTTSSTSDSVYYLSPGSVYYARVLAYSDWYGDKKLMDQSAVIKVGTKPEVGTVEGLKQTDATANTITMSWTGMSGAAKYEVYRYNSYDNYTKVGETTSTSYTVSGLTASMEVRYFIIATKVGGTGLTANSTSYKTVYMRTAPAKVPNIAMTDFYDSINVAYYGWNTVNNADGYQVQLLNYKGKTLLNRYEAGGSTRISPYWKGVFVKARVRAYIMVNNKRVFGPWSGYNYNASSKKITLKRSANKKKITLKWKKISGAAGYKIQISTKSGSGFKTVKTVSSKKSSYTITKYGKKKLSKKKKYYIRLQYLTKVGKKKVASGIMGSGSI